MGCGRCILRGIRLHKCPYWVRPGITISDHNGRSEFVGVVGGGVAVWCVEGVWEFCLWW